MYLYALMHLNAHSGQGAEHGSSKNSAYIVQTNVLTTRTFYLSFSIPKIKRYNIVKQNLISALTHHV